MDPKRFKDMKLMKIVNSVQISMKNISDCYIQ